MNNSTTVELRTGDWSALRDDAASVRRAVFIVEQAIPEPLEWDEHDATSTHVVAYAQGVPIATGRLLPDARIGRMAVLGPYRRTAVGTRVLLHLVGIARERGWTQVELSAQTYVRDFYARHGFVAFGPVYDDAGIPHQSMRLRLTAPV